MNRRLLLTRITIKAATLNLFVACCICPHPLLAQETGKSDTVPIQPATEVQTNNTILEKEKEKDKDENNKKEKCTKFKIAGLHIAVWKPAKDGKAPLVIFSHGSGGKNTQSKFIMRALAQDGYLVIAPNHKDATITGISLRPDFTYKRASKWTDKTFESRRQDIVKLLAALHEDPLWDEQIDWTKLALAGHSLGGYTMFGMVGAWPSWTIDGVKAVLGFSPYCQPFFKNGDLSNVSVPAMYQGGTRDRGITPSIKGPDGAFSKTPPPAYFVEFDRVGHLAWTNFNHNKKKQELINHYGLAFLDKYVKDSADADLTARLEGVSEMDVK
jgi:dienelactone hydrolase